MARIRAIHPRAPQDDDVASMSLEARYLWAYLPCHADREGRMEERPLMLKGEVFPADSVDVAVLLTEMEERRFIVRYRGANGRRLIQIRNFHTYQRPDHRERASVLQAPDGWEDVGQNLGKGRKLEDRTQGKVGQNPGLDLGKATECNESSSIVSGRDRSGTPGSGTDTPPRVCARSNPPAKFRPDSTYNLKWAIKTAVEKAQPQIGQWAADGFADRDGDAFFATIGDVDRAVPEIQRKIGIFAADPEMSPWNVGKFTKEFNRLGQPRATRPGQQPGRVVPIVES